MVTRGLFPFNVEPVLEPESEPEPVTIERVWDKDWIPRSAYVVYHRKGKTVSVMDCTHFIRVPVEVDFQVEPHVVRYQVDYSFYRDFTIDEENFFKTPYEKLP